MERIFTVVRGDVRIYVADIEKTVATAAEMHGISERETSLLGYVESLSVCLAAMQKDPESSFAVMAQDGINGLSACSIAEPHGIVRGYASPVEKDGRILLQTVLRLPIKGDYTGIVDSDVSVDDAVCRYLENSAQTDAFILSAEENGRFVCLLGEQLPGGNDLLKIKADIVGDNTSFTPDGLVGIFGEEEIMQSSPICYGCTCTPDAVYEKLASLSDEDWDAMAEEDGCIEITCKYCGKKYRFSR